MNKISELTFSKSRIAKSGTYTFVISLIVLAALIIANLLVSAIPKSLTLIDTSTTGIYSISDNTKNYLSSVSDKITIHQIAPGRNGDIMLSAFLEKYTASSRNISANILNTDDDPTCLDKYSLTTSSVSNYSLIVESEKRFDVIDYSELFTFYNSYLAESYGIGEVSYAVYQQYMYYFYAAENAGYATEQKFCGEDIITQAVEYVSLDTIPQIYLSSGHGESGFSDTLLSFVEGNGFPCVSLSYDATYSIPENATCIVIYAPKEDISKNEAIAIKKFLNNGGNMLLITSSVNLSMPNLMSLVDPYGVVGVPGTVYDGNSENPLVIPTPNSSHAVTSYVSSYSIIMPNAHGIRILDDNGIATVASLFTTPENAVVKNDGEASPAQSISLGVAIQTQNSNIVWYSSADAFTDSVAETSSYGNYYYALYSLAWLYEPYESALTKSGGVSITEPLLDQITFTSIIIWATILIVIIPLGIIISGFIVWIKRRKR